ncbi:MAG: DUF4105 domain-containing protein [Bacteriovoracaceae bacterium]|nr:DUF4105 domain-containing protein [Bacteriovoracaceae bacterium]
MRHLILLSFVFLSSFALAGERPQLLVSPDVALLIELDLIELEGLGGSVLANPEKSVEIHVEKFKKDGLLNDNLCDDSLDKIYARVKHTSKKSKIEINEKLINLAYAVDTVFPCKHGTFKNFLKASLWHELGHVWDNQNKFSTTGAYSALMGGGSAFKATGNRAASASPDAYEFKNLKESFAVNLEWFLLDSDFECRKPATYQLMSEALGFRPHQTNCEQNWKVMTQSAYPEDHFTRSFEINPERIFQVHYFFAGRGDALMSRWGHAMLRLVVCAPHRKTVGPECMQDVSHHLILSYRASIENPQINYIDGFTGKYPSLMFVYRFHEILQEYGKQELRELWSIPLPLSREKIEFFTKVTLERYWSYQGKYLFLSNNCGTESLRHLLAVDDKLFDDIGDFTPLQLFRGLSRLDGFEDLTDDKDHLRSMGLYFPSQRKEIENAITVLAESQLSSTTKLKEFLKSSPEDRLEIYKQRDWNSFSNTENRTALLNIQYIERYMAMLFNMNLMKNISKRVEKDAELKAMLNEQFQSFIALIKRPWDVAADGYGVPSINGFEGKFSEYLVFRKKIAAQNKVNPLDILLAHPLFEKEAAEANAMRGIGTLIADLLIKNSGLGGQL